MLPAEKFQISLHAPPSRGRWPEAMRILFPPRDEEGGGALQEASRKQNKDGALKRPARLVAPSSTLPLAARLTRFLQVHSHTPRRTGPSAGRAEHRGLPGRAPVRKTGSAAGAAPPFPWSSGAPQTLRMKSGRRIYTPVFRDGDRFLQHVYSSETAVEPETCRGRRQNSIPSPDLLKNSCPSLDHEGAPFSPARGEG